MSRFSTVRELTAQQWRRDSPDIEHISRTAPDEVPIGISYNDKPHAVLMATPQDVEDLAVGFTITESSRKRQSSR